MRSLAIVLAATLACGLSGGPAAAHDGLCPNPKQMQGFKTCADVAKAEQEGEVVIYATNPEQAELKVLARFSEMFPKIKPTYLRLQAGALMAKVQSERQAQTYLAGALARRVRDHAVQSARRQEQPERCERGHQHG